MKPQRIQRKRTKGWRMPANTVYVGRPTKFGNPFTLLQCYEEAFLELKHMRHEIPSSQIDQDWQNYARAILIQKYKSYLADNPMLINEAKNKLKGKNLACFCKPGDPCHADILLTLANS